MWRSLATSTSVAAASVAIAMGACATPPPPRVVLAPALGAAPGPSTTGDGWRFEREIENVGAGTASRFFPSLRVLHQDAVPGHAGLDHRILPTGAVGETLEPMRTTGTCTDRRILTVVGPWPRAAWAVSRCEDDVGPRQSWSDQLLEWKNGAWDVASDPWSAHQEPIHLVPWGDDAALVVTELAFPDPFEPGGEVVCLPARGQITVGTSRATAPTILSGRCDFAPLAVAATPAGDLFVVGRPMPETVGNMMMFMERGPLEVRRWRPGVATPERDELVSSSGDALVFHGSDDFEPLLVVSATEAYFAVMGHSPESDTTLLRFDGRAWTPVLDMPTPLAALQRSPDGAIWIVDGDGVIHRQLPPPAAAGFHALRGHSVPRDDGPARDVHVTDVMPLDADRASVLATWDGRIGLFTVVVPPAASAPP